MPIEDFESGDDQNPQDFERGERPNDRQAEVLESLRQTLMETDSSRTQLAQLLADPDINALYQAKKSGRKASLKISDPDEEEDEPTPGVADADLDAMSPSQLAKTMNAQLAKSMPKIVKGVVKQVMQQFSQTELAPLRQQVQQIGGYIGQQAQQTASQQLDKLREKFPDVNFFMKDMGALAQQNPGLNAEELYHIAKRRKGGDLPPRRQMSSERPNAGMGRRSAPVKQYSLGEKGMQEMIAEALGDLNTEDFRLE